MDFQRVGGYVRAVRIRLRRRQVDVASRAGVSPRVIGRIEHGRLKDVSLPALLAVAEALEIRLDLIVRWRGGDLDRMVNANHAALAEAVVRLLEEAGGWEVRPEVSFAFGGERGVIDLLAWHARARTVLVIELKTDVVDVGGMLGVFDRKRRLAWRVAAGLGWRPETVATALIVSDTRTNRRRVELHARTFRSALGDDTRRFRAWLRAPAGGLAALAFATDRRQAPLRQGSATPRRVRPRQKAA